MLPLKWAGFHGSVVLLVPADHIMFLCTGGLQAYSIVPPMLECYRSQPSWLMGYIRRRCQVGIDGIGAGLQGVCTGMR
jgi:hypothetical protein